VLSCPLGVFGTGNSSEVKHIGVCFGAVATGDRFGALRLMRTYSEAATSASFVAGILFF
jgi:hypothetical protein